MKKGHNYAVDIWSLGVIIYAMLIGKPPFETSEVKKTYQRIKRNIYHFPDSSIIKISQNAKNLIESLLVSDPSKRLTLDEIMKHPFMNNEMHIPSELPTSIRNLPPTNQFIRSHYISS